MKRNKYLDNTDFKEFVANDVKKQKGIFHPVKASFLERLLVKKVSCKKLHPNESDEFTFADIGPSYRIISEYEKNFRHLLSKGQRLDMEPLTIEKLYPHGYLLLNGHHRWAAAMRAGIKRVPVEIVNLAQESDIKKILENSKHNKRVTLDLDEVVFKSNDDPHLEKPLFFPFKLKFKKRIRLGIPALFYFLSKNGYDIWVYSANYYSIDDIRSFFRHYSVNVDGIITGTAKKKLHPTKADAEMDQLIANKYQETLHIDNNMILLTHKETGDFDEYELNANAEDWSRNAITIIGEIENARKTENI
jgi:hypothetical protein